MGERYYVTVKCPKCGFTENDVYYAPTCGIISWECPKCEYVVNLEEYTGISYEEASNLDIIQKIVDCAKEKEGVK